MSRNRTGTTGFIVLLVLFILMTGYNLFRDVKGGTPDENAVRKIVADYIEQNPEAILNSLTAYQQKAQDEQMKNAQASVSQYTNELEHDAASPVAGNPNGDVTIVEFFDYSCGYCKHIYPSIAKLMEQDKNLRFVFKEFPILGPNSVVGAKAATAVFMMYPEKYFAFHTALMNGRITGEDSVLDVASRMGIDKKSLQEKMESKEVTDHLQKNRDLATKLNIHGTPGLVIGGQLIPGAIDYDAFVAQIANARNGKQAPAAN